MALGYGIFWWSAHPSWPLAAGVGLFFLASAVYVLSRPAPRTTGASANGEPSQR
ncbi:hypothetical protein D3C72_1286830 [compost metagenome]